MEFSQNMGKKKTKPKKLPEVLTLKEFNTILKYTKKQEHRLAFKLGFLSGLRISEIINLRYEDINRDRKLIFIRQGKGKKDRYTPLPPMLQEKELKSLPLKIGIRALQISFKNKCKKYLNRDLHFHNLRHSFATNLLSKGIPITEVQMWLGHSRLDTTSVYLKVSPETALKNYNEIWK